MDTALQRIDGGGAVPSDEIVGRSSRRLKPNAFHQAMFSAVCAEGNQGQAAFLGDLASPRSLRAHSNYQGTPPSTENSSEYGHGKTVGGIGWGSSAVHPLSCIARIRVKFWTWRMNSAVC